MQEHMNKLFRLFSKHKKGRLSDPEAAAFQKVQQEDPEMHRQLDRIWSASGSYKEGAWDPDVESGLSRLHQRLGKEVVPGPRPVWRNPILRVAASLVFLLVAGAVIRHFVIGDQPGLLEVVNARQDQEVHRLPDGSLVRLSPGATLTYPDNLNDLPIREVSVTGTGYFAVTSRPEQPFIVHTEVTDIRVLGTRFLVVEEANAGRTIVEVEEGKVAFHERGSRDTLVLAHAERGVCITGGDMLKESFLIEEIQTPTHTINVFRERLSSLADQLYTWSNEDLIVPAALSDCEISGRIDISSRHRFMESIQALGYEISEGTAGSLLLSGACPEQSSN
jgi:ferric-dicitrate binding protein FerR (iron transport regulator)